MAKKKDSLTAPDGAEPEGAENAEAEEFRYPMPRRIMLPEQSAQGASDAATRAAGEEPGGPELEEREGKTVVDAGPPVDLAQQPAERIAGGGEV